MPEELWGLTLREFNIKVRAFNRNVDEDARRVKIGAWFTAQLSRVERMPDLRVFLGIGPKPLSEEDKEKRRQEHQRLIEEMG